MGSPSSDPLLVIVLPSEWKRPRLAAVQRFIPPYPGVRLTKQEGERIAFVR